MKIWPDKKRTKTHAWRDSNEEFCHKQQPKPIEEIFNDIANKDDDGRTTHNDDEA